MRDGPVLATVTAAFAFLVVSMLADPWSAFLRERGFTARNFAGVELPVGMGLLLLFPLAAVASGPLAGVPGAALYLAVVLGFALTGLIDDAAEEPGVRGIRGHLRALLRQRRLTGGGVKLAAGILLALLAGASAPSLPERVADASLVALAANAWNALDVRPGRALKVYLAALPLAAGVAAGVVAGGTPLLPLWA
ncbi:MAG: hypothetical protein IRY95_09135, partial [Clostridia bacterium]|nr:hypothetical protein [Clostridia bacterium]